MTEDEQAVAIIGVSTEEIKERRERKKIVFIASNDKSFTRGCIILKVDSRKFEENQPGTYFQGDPYGFRIFSPRPEDLIIRKSIGSNEIIFYKLWCYNSDYFQDGHRKKYGLLVSQVINTACDRMLFPPKNRVYKFINSLFRGKRSVRGTTEGMPIEMTTPCHDFFHADSDGVSMGIGSPIEERFGLEKFSFEHGLVSHWYRSVSHDFFEKYPKEMIETKSFTLERLCSMVYDLVKIKHGINCK